MVIGSGILSGLALTEEDSSVCSVLSVFFLVQLALFLGCLCVLQPYSEALAHSVNVLLTLLGLLWAVLNEIPSARDSTFFQSLPEVQMWVSVVMVGTAFIVLLVEGKWYRHWRWIWSSCGCSSCGSRRRKRIRRRRRSSGRDSLPHPHQHHSNIINHDSSSSSSSSHSRRSSDDEEEEEDDDDDGVYDEEFAITVASTFSLAQQRSLEYLVQTICQQQQQQQQQQTLNRSEEIDEKADDGGASPPSALI